jgi:hypothetical protein
MFAGIKRRQRNFRMKARRRAYRNRLDLVRFNQIRIVGITPRDAEFAGDSFQPRRICVGQSDNLDAGHSSERRQVALFCHAPAPD